MTRSVEIPEAAVEAAIDVVMDDGHNGIQCAPDRNLAVTVRAALEAARPHIEAAMCNCPTDAGVTSAMRTETGQHLATCPLALYPAPAGDGGLREALTELAKERDSVSGHTPGDYSIRPYELFDLLKAHPATPAVPQPVDREALAKAIHDAACGGG